MKVYTAGPDGFTAAGRLWHFSVLVPALTDLGVEVLDPWVGFDDEFAALLALPYGPERRDLLAALNARVGASNTSLIDEADGVLAVLDGLDLDPGTASEVGYAYARGKKIVGLRTDVRLAGDNDGSVVNLQVEYFIHAAGGVILHDPLEAAARLVELLPEGHS